MADKENTKFEASTKLESAISMVLESNPQKWGASQHMALLRYLALQCSNMAKAVPGEINGKKCLVLDGKPVDEIVIKWDTLKEEFSQSGKLAECANFYKWLQDCGNMKAAIKSADEYL